MTVRKTQLASAMAVSALLFGMAGCANTGDMDSLRSEIRQANDTAQEALSTARAASEESAAASETAQQAMDMARDAKAASEATDEKVDRMFKKSMYK